jgi:hypothetical protein
MMDPKRNLLTVMLGGLIAVLVAGAALQAVLLGKVDVDQIGVSGDTGIDDSQVDVPETGLEQLDRYRAITDRPIFFSDRRLPVVEVVDTSDEEDLAISIEPEEEQIEDLKARVAGIIITPDMRMALVQDEVAGKTVMLREGMSLEGEQAAWRIETIEPRFISFVSVDGRASDLELQVNTSGLKAGSPGQVRRRTTSGDEPAAPDEEQQLEAEVADPPTDARARAEEVRRRVAERRAELRAEAERRAQQQQRQRQDN